MINLWKERLEAWQASTNAVTSQQIEQLREKIDALEAWRPTAGPKTGLTPASSQLWFTPGTGTGLDHFAGTRIDWEVLTITNENASLSHSSEAMLNGDYMGTLQKADFGDFIFTQVRLSGCDRPTIGDAWSTHRAESGTIVITKPSDANLCCGPPDEPMLRDI
ncbi:MAG: hypothetical protein ACREK5_08515 [Gemmatimonadota bacterium]